MFENRLRKMARHLGKWARRTGVTCYRVYDRDVPGYPLAVDLYEGAVHAQEYERKHPLDASEHEAWIAEVREVLTRTFDVEESDLFLKLRRRQKDFSQYQRLDDAAHERVVHEGPHRFLVNLSDYLDSGLFLDHRITRALVAEEACGTRFLNLFAYTGSFTVYAAGAGASETTTVDLSNRYLGWAARNLELNRLAGPAHSFERADALSFLAREAREGRRYDLVVCDPPTFSRSKRMAGVFDVQKHHPGLIQRCLRVLAPGGRLYFSTNFRRFRLCGDELSACRVEDLTKRTIPHDFRDKRVHQCFRITAAP